MALNSKVPKFVFLLLSIGILAIGYHPAYGNQPQVTSFVANDPDDDVSNGFNYNGNAIGVENYFTPYPLITVNVGQKNTATFKIFDDNGPENIRHFEFAFGLRADQYITINKASIIWEKFLGGIEIVLLNDPENVLDDVNVRSSTGSCSSGSSKECLILVMDHTFRAPLDFDIIGTNVWDSTRNAWQNYYNHGIEIVDESLNPPKEYYGIYKGDLIHLIETGKNTAIDSDGNTWTFDNTWSMDYSYVGKLDKAISSHGLDRKDVQFNTYKQGQSLLASSIMGDLYKTTISYEEPFAEIDNIMFYEFPDRIDKKFDPVLQAKMHEEAIRAEKILKEMFDAWYHHED